MYKSVFKYIIDFALSIIGIILLSPVFLIVFIALFISNKGKVFFFQKRPGKNGKLFTIIKFKTMNDSRNSKGELLPDDERVTKIGNFIRNTSLDEIPQFLNVLKGEMSFIGPRPLLPEYMPLYNTKQRKRHLVKPGITGWAQINGRNAIAFDKKIDFDVWYVENISFLLDLQIMFLTLKKMINTNNSKMVKETHRIILNTNE